jgi:hypothetical protein
LTPPIAARARRALLRKTGGTDDQAALERVIGLMT